MTLAIFYFFFRYSSYTVGRIADYGIEEGAGEGGGVDGLAGDLGAWEVVVVEVGEDVVDVISTTISPANRLPRYNSHIDIRAKNLSTQVRTRHRNTPTPHKRVIHKVPFLH